MKQNYSFLLKKGIFLGLTAFLFPLIAQAVIGAPKIIHHQGLLLDSEGVPLGDGGTEFCFKFSIYDDSEVGASDTKLWPVGEPSPAAIMVKKGFFSAEIGDPDLGEPLNLPQGIDANLFLQIEAANKIGENCRDGDEEFETLEPRQAVSLTATPVLASPLICKEIFTKEITLEQNGRIYLPSGENQIAGHGLIFSGQSEAFIPNNSIETSSFIIITPVSFISSPLYIKEKRAGGFVVATAFAPAEDIIFDWIVFHTTESAPSQNSSQNIDGGGQPVVNIDGGSSGPHIDGGAASIGVSPELSPESLDTESGSSTPAQSQELPNLAEINEFSSSTPINPLEEGEAVPEPLIGQTLGQ